VNNHLQYHKSLPLVKAHRPLEVSQLVHTPPSRYQEIADNTPPARADADHSCYGFECLRIVRDLWITFRYSHPNRLPSPRPAPGTRHQCPSSPALSHVRMFSRWKPLLVIAIYCLISQMQLSGGPPYCHSIHEPLTLRSQVPLANWGSARHMPAVFRLATPGKAIRHGFWVDSPVG
jgi:hypothetical protein